MTIHSKLWVLPTISHLFERVYPQKSPHLDEVHLVDECVGLWMLKKWSLVIDERGTGISERLAAFGSSAYAATVAGPIDGVLRNRTTRLMFWAVAARKNCSWTNFNRRRRRR